ncbi:hypothetical protein EIP86_004250 [Pleurotus ostreatoroseus]|nr:hypothetical protein EIP86_004250 [Pleurotus ostreatoroseus]
MPPRRSVASSSKKRERDSSDASDTEDSPARSATKRKAATPESDNSDSQSSKPIKKAKTSQSSKSRKEAKTSPSVSTERASIGQPTNKVLPVHIEFPPKIADTLRLATWNICGLAASSRKVHGLSRAGTAILSKIKPLEVTYTLPGHPDPKSVKGRIVTLEFDTTYVVGTYVVNAGNKLKTLEEKKTWNAHFTNYIRDLDKKKPVIWTGDLNVAPTALDLANPKTNWNKTPGYTEAETTAFAQILTPYASQEGPGKFIDVWRQLHPKLRHYTYFSYRFNCREKGIGWRLDTCKCFTRSPGIQLIYKNLVVTSERIAEKVKACEIRGEIYGASDHCPVMMEIAGTL